MILILVNAMKKLFAKQLQKRQGEISNVAIIGFSCLYSISTWFLCLLWLIIQMSITIYLAKSLEDSLGMYEIDNQRLFLAILLTVMSAIFMFFSTIYQSRKFNKSLAF